MTAYDLRGEGLFKVNLKKIKNSQSVRGRDWGATASREMGWEGPSPATGQTKVFHSAGQAGGRRPQ